MSEVKECLDDLLRFCLESCDVRLQVYASGEWAIRYGPSDYDLNHHGYWGASSIQPKMSDSEVEAIARDLIDQATDHYYAEGSNE